MMLISGKNNLVATNDEKPNEWVAVEPDIFTRSKFSKGDRVIWSYIHHLNSKSSTVIIKHGRYVARVKHTARYIGPQLAWVEFDGNKRLSKVPYWELEPETEGGEE